MRRFRVTLLGSGHPYPSPDRFGPSTLVEAGEQRILVDTGRGTTIRLWQLGIPLSGIDRLLLTHFHSDHTCGLPDLWLTGSLSPVWASRKAPLRVTGPVGTARLTKYLREAYKSDIDIRLIDERLPPDGIEFDVTEFERDGVVYENDGLKIIAFEVDHGDAIKPCYGYKFEYEGRSAVLSGDTRYNENVVAYGSGADLIIHEVGAVRQELLSESGIKHVMDHHTSPEEAGRVFLRAKPKLAAFTHIVLLGSSSVEPMTAEEIVSQTREVYSGPLVIGEDLMTFEITNDVVIKPWNSG